MMNAAIAKTYGSPEVLELVAVPKPELGETDVLIETKSSVVTQGDRRIRSGDFPGFTAVLGRLFVGLTGPREPVQGTMFSGEVVDVGSKVSHFQIGDRVFGSVDHGAHAQYVKVAESGKIARVPEGVTHADASAISYGAITALVFLRDFAKLRKNERVLVLGAAGGVGHFAVQIAKYYGAHVTAVCSAKDINNVRNNGADRALDYRTENPFDGTETYDVVFDTADVARFSKVEKHLNIEGRYLTLYVSLRVIFEMLLTKWVGRRRALVGVAFGEPSDFELLAQLMLSGAIRPRIAKVYNFREIVDAHRAIENKRVSGSIVLDFSNAA